MKCPYCNMDNPDGQKFCGNCGKPIIDSQPQQSSWIDDRQQVQRMPKFYELTWVISLRVFLYRRWGLYSCGCPKDQKAELPEYC